jgi:hypothetical protein
VEGSPGSLLLGYFVLDIGKHFATLKTCSFRIFGSIDAQTVFGLQLWEPFNLVEYGMQPPVDTNYRGIFSQKAPGVSQL